MWYWKNIIIPETQKWHRGVTWACLTRVSLSWSEVLVTMVTESFKLENHTLEVAKKVFPELLSSCSLCLFVQPFPNPGTFQKLPYEVTWTLQAGKKAWVLMLCHTSQNIKICYLDLRLGPEKIQDKLNKIQCGDNCSSCITWGPGPFRPGLPLCVTFGGYPD